MTRGEIWLVNLNPTVGSEIRKTRPFVVVSPAEMYDHLHTVIVAPMTTRSRAAPFRIGVTHGGKKGLILLARSDARRGQDPVSEEAGKGAGKNAHLHLEHATRSFHRVSFNSSSELSSCRIE